MPDRAVGIDLGQTLVWAVAAERRRSRWTVTDGRSFGSDELDAVVAWCGDAVVAVDAPGGRSEGAHAHDERVAGKFRRARCAEVALRLAGFAVPFVAPGPDDEVAPWMQVGFDLWAAFGDRQPLEVFPYSVFATLLGTRPPNKLTGAGRRCRLDALAPHLALPGTASLWAHDGIDAAAAALVAADHVDGGAVRLGCDAHDGSAMWLPAPRPR